MQKIKDFEFASIDQKCNEELSQLETKLSQTNEKEIVLVAYEKK